MTGDSGQYAIFGITEGLTKLTIEVDVDGEVEDYPILGLRTSQWCRSLCDPTLVPFLDLP